jgi:hypothetical protein
VAVCEATLESARQNIIGAPSVNVAGSALTLKYSVALGVLRGPDRVYSVHIVAHTRSSGGVSWDVGVKKKQDGNRADAADLQNIDMIENVWTGVLSKPGVTRADILDSFEAAMTLFSVSSPTNSGSSMNNY